MRSDVHRGAVIGALALAVVLGAAGSAHAGSIAAGPLTAPRRNHAAIVLADGDVLLIGGINNSSTTPRYPQGAVERYDVATRWASAQRARGAPQPASPTSGRVARSKQSSRSCCFFPLHAVIASWPIWINTPGVSFRKIGRAHV